MIVEQHLGIKSAGSSDDSLGGRLPLIASADLSDAQRDLYDYMEHSRIPEALKGGYEARLPDGRFIGPFNAFLRIPEISRALNGWVDAFDEHATLAPDLRQVIVLTVGAYWKAEYELYAHTAAGRKAGLSEAAIDAINAGREPEDVSAEAAAAYRFVHTLVTERSISDDVYAATVAVFGVERVMEILTIVGIYQTVSGLLTTFRVPAP